MNNPPKPDFTVPEASAALRCTNPTIYRLIAQGQLETYRVGRKRLITRKSLLRKMKRSEAAAR